MAALILPLIFAALLYFLFIRPQQRQMRQHRELIASVQVGDEIITASGIYGTITELDDDDIWVEIGEGVVVRMARRAVAEVAIDDADVPDGDGPDTDTDNADLDG
jgi:preprotein translocase subunit YajC